MSVCTATHRARKSAHTHTQPLTPPPPGLIHLLHLRMRALWCHLQSHYFKSTKAPQCHQYKEQTHPLTSSFVPMSPNSNSPAESPYPVKGELQSVLYNQVFLSFCPLAPITCTTVTMTSFLCPSSILLTWKKLPWCMNLCALKMHLVCVWVKGGCAVRIPWLQCCQWTALPEAPTGNTHKQGMMWWDKAIIQPPH